MAPPGGKSPAFADPADQNTGLRFLVTLAAAFILVQGLRFAQPILLPMALALFLAIICLPLVIWLSRRRVPLTVAILMTVLVVAGVFGLLVLIGSQQMRSLQELVLIQIDAIAPHIDSWLRGIEDRIAVLDEGELQRTFRELLNVTTLATLATGATTWALSFVTSTFVVTLLLIFALGEAVALPEKLRFISDGVADQRYRKMIDEVQGYLVIKTLVSLCTGVLLGIWTWTMGLELPLLFGLIAFALNYVPTIGSIIASIPAVLLALLDVDPATATLVGINLDRSLIVGLGYLAVNVIFGNWIEPMMMGRRFGISTLVVILSLLFWGWLWGPVGALLSVPLTMIVKIMLENTKDLRWIAVLIDKNPAAVAAGEEGMATG